ncbi:MAG: DNA alkylation repair protein [Candidatus Kerfeldbacteria bacterium]|nr:DNA alkylation repair protein [Candidatus Kerfeldbacteria bacterium]
MTAARVRRDLRQLSRPAKAKILKSFFKTGPDQYGSGDRFIGVAVPDQRRVARKYATLSLGETAKLLGSPIHEHRLTALIIIGNAYASAARRGRIAEVKQIGRFIFTHRSRINNWDLVDTITPLALGPYILAYERRQLIKLARSKNFWDRRIAIISTFPSIRRGDFADTFRLSAMLLDDDHDLIHKSVGWMLREVGNRDRPRLLSFLRRHATRMPRTMLRYAIEKLPATQRASFLKLKLLSKNKYSRILN